MACRELLWSRIGYSFVVVRIVLGRRGWTNQKEVNWQGIFILCWQWEVVLCGCWPGIGRAGARLKR